MPLPRSVRFVAPALAALLVLSTCASAEAQTRKPRTPRTPRGLAAAAAPGPKDYQSRNFVVHTDLPPEKAADLLKRLETMLGIISRYWGQPNRQPIECYVVEDLANWPAGAFSAGGRAKIEEGAGVTESLVRYNAATGRPLAAKSIVYAVADHGTPQHEAVHAYCAQNFGHTGPTWYSEGMAEMGNYWRVDDPSVELPEVVLDYLQNSPPKPLLAIVDNTDQTGDSWENYAWRWALCHLLANNPNYAARFRPLGLNLLLDKDDSFEKTYGAMAKEIAFEYRFFLDHLENGVRADLTAWDWRATFKPAAKGRTLAATVEAARGWQPSRLRVESGKTYKIETAGAWKVEKTGPDLTAAGTPAASPSTPAAPTTDATAAAAAPAETPAEDAGKLVGIVLDPTNYSLGQPFDLPASGPFTVPAEGHLYLRCQDGWGKLADNSGKVDVKLSLAE